jgi:urea transport system substrate-binding protein
MVFNRREFLKTAATASAALTLPALGGRAFAADAIKVGALYSQTGGLSVAEKLLANGVMMAVAEINAAGGVLGRPVEVVVEDGASDPKIFSEKASKLILKDFNRIRLPHIRQPQGRAADLRTARRDAVLSDAL